MPDIGLDEIRELYQQFMQAQGAQGPLASQYGEDVGAAYGAAAQPYQPSTMSRVAGYGGLLAAGLAAGGVGGRSARPMLGLLAGAGAGYAGGQEDRFMAERDRTLQNQLGMLGTQYGAESTALGAQGDVLQTGISAYDAEQQRMAAEAKAAESTRRFGLQHGLNVRREDRLSQERPAAAKPMFTPSQELNQLGQRFDQRRIGFRNELDELLESRYPNQFGNLTSQGTIYAKPRKIQNLLDTGDIGEKVDRPGWFTGDDIYPDQDVQALMDSLGVYDPSRKLDWQMQQMRGGQPAAPQQGGIGPPPPNDGSFTDEEYRIFVERWNRGEYR